MERPAVKVSSGLIYQDKFTDLSAWTNDGTWTSVSNPAFVSFGALQSSPFTHGTTFDRDGVREPNPFIDDDGTYYMLYDGGDGATGWTSFIARSYDQGLTWEKLGQMPPGYANGSGGNVRVNAMGYLTKFNGKYCYYRVTGMNLFNEALPGNPNIGLPAPPYTGDMWESTSILSGWVYKGALTKVTGTWTESEHLPCSVFKAGSTYYLCSEGAAPGGYYQIGLSSGSTPFGPWTQMNPSIYAPTVTSHGAENSKIFFHPTINKWIMLSNLIAADNTVTDQNAIHISNSPTDWTGATIRILHRICPMDGARAIGVVAPINIPDGTYISPNGDVPIYYDSNPEKYGVDNLGNPAGWHLGRKLEGSTMELSTNALKFENATAGANRTITKGITNDDFVAEFGVQFANTTTGTNIFFTYRATGGNGYRLTIRNGQWLLLQRVTGGVPTTLFSATSGLTTIANFISRIKVVVQGSSHKAYIDGELQINVTDNTYTTGQNIGFGGFNASNAEVRLFNMRKSDVVTINGLLPNKKVTLRTSIGMGVMSANVNDAGVLTVPSSHFPLSKLNLNDIDFTTGSDVWGGDVYTINTVVRVSLQDSTIPTGSIIRKPLTTQSVAVSGTTVKKRLSVN